MSHPSWREIDPAGAKRHDALSERRSRLRAELTNVPLGEFTVGELEALLRLMGVFNGGPGIGFAPAYESHLDLLEAKLETLKGRT